MIGEIVKGYRVIHKIGEGGMGEVYFAQDSLGQNAAIKVLREEYRNRPDLKARFLIELKAMIRLQGHPNIVALKSTTNVEDPIIIMEYLEGEDLYSYIKKRNQPIEEPTLIEWAKQIISALSYAHNMNPKIIHRDIKPSNIFITKFNVIKILDFGIAKVVQENASGEVDDTLLDTLTKTRSNLGAPQYMSPEQSFDPKLVTHLSDIYSLGKTIYYLATGGNPMIKLSPMIAAIVKKCTEQHPAERYQSWDEVLYQMGDIREIGGKVGIANIVSAPATYANNKESDVARVQTYKLSDFGETKFPRDTDEWIITDSTATYGGSFMGIKASLNMIAGKRKISLVFPNLKKMPMYAFHDCKSLTSINLPIVEEIGERAFCYCESLTSVHISTAKKIGHEAFGFCRSLTSVYVPNAKYIFGRAFYGCWYLERLTLPHGCFLEKDTVRGSAQIIRI